MEGKKGAATESRLICFPAEKSAGYRYALARLFSRVRAEEKRSVSGDDLNLSTKCEIKGRREKNY